MISQGSKIKIEKLEGNPGDSVVFDDVLFRGDKDGVSVGLPNVKDGKITGTIIAQGRHDKVTGVKHKAKKRYKMKFGHKQPYTEVEIGKV